MPVAQSTPASATKTTRKIKLNTGLAGERKSPDGKRVLGTFSHGRGDVIEWDAKEAQGFIDRGWASPVTE